MVLALPDKKAHTCPGHVRLGPLIAFGLASMIFAAGLVGSHHHHDLRDHPDCSICTVAHHAPAATTAATPVTTVQPVQPALFALLLPAVPLVRQPSPLHSRAPPPVSTSDDLSLICKALI